MTARTKGVALCTAGVLTLLFGRYAGSLLVVRVSAGKPDAILVLGGREYERLPGAAELAVAHPSAALLLTQPRVVGQYNCDDCAHRIDRLVAAGVSRSSILVLPDLVSNTFDEALAMRAYAGQHANVRSILIVTSTYHTRRALATVRHVLKGTGVNIGIEPTSRSHATPARWWARPGDRRYVIYEWLASVTYFARYGVLTFP